MCFEGVGVGVRATSPPNSPSKHRRPDTRPTDPTHDQPERQAVVLELDDRLGRLAAHVLDRVLVAEPVAALDRVVRVPAPVVLGHVAERRVDAALRGDGVRARREELGDAAGGVGGFVCGWWGV